MNPNDLPAALTAPPLEAADLLSPLLQGPALGVAAPAATKTPAPIHGVLVGELLALADGGTTPLVRYDGQPTALRARSTVDLHGPHIGQPVALMFEGGDPTRPIVMGVVRQAAGWPLAEPPAQVEVDADGQRLIVSAKEQMVLRCGKASITLTKAGKVLIEGSYVLSRSTGVNRVKGGSVQLN
jgi:hypothetical protein